MIAGQDAQPARIDRQRLGDGEFGAEISDARHVLDVRRATQVLLEIGVPLEDALCVLGQSRGLVDGGLQGGDRVMSAPPGLGRQSLEEIARRRIP